MVSTVRAVCYVFAQTICYLCFGNGFGACLRQMPLSHPILRMAPTAGYSSARITIVDPSCTTTINFNGGNKPAESGHICQCKIVWISFFNFNFICSTDFRF